MEEQLCGGRSADVWCRAALPRATGAQKTIWRRFHSYRKAVRRPGDAGGT